MCEAAGLRRPLIIGMFLLLFCIYVFVLIFNEMAPTGMDDAVSLVSGKSLAEGRGYRLINDPEAPPARHYPIVYSFILSLVWVMFPNFPENLIYFRFLSTVAAVGFLWLTYCYLVRFDYATRRMALATVTVTGLNPVFVIMSGNLQADVIYSLITVAALYWVGRWQIAPKGSGIGVPLLATGLLAMAPLTRYVGLTLNGAAVLTFIRQRDYRKVALIISGMLVVLGPWAVWVYVNRAFGYGDFFSDLLSLNLRELVVTNAGKKLFNLWQEILPYYLFPHLRPTSLLSQYAGSFAPFRFLLFLARISIFVFCIVGIVRWKRTGQQIVVWYLAGYFLILLAWDTEFFVERYLVPLSPFLVLSLFQGVEVSVRSVARIWTGGWLQTRGRDLALAAVIGLAVLSSLGPAARQIYNAYIYGHIRGAEWAKTEQACQVLVNWVRTNVPQQAIIASELAHWLFLYTGRPVFPTLPSATLDHRRLTEKVVETLLREKNVDYLVHFPHRGWSHGVVSKYIRESPESFSLLHKSGPCAEVYEVRNSRSHPDR